MPSWLTRNALRWLAVGALISLLAVAVACGDDDDDDDDVDPEAQLCADLEDLEGAVAELEALSADSTVDEATIARDDAQEAYDTVLESAEAVSTARVEALETAYDDLVSSIDDLEGEETIGDAYTALEPQIEAVAQARAELGTEAGCDGDATSAATDGATDAPSGEALKIGALLSFTGALADFGEPIYTGAELAVAEINESGGVLGQDVELVRADDGTTPQQGITSAQNLVDVEGVQAIIGALSSGVSVQVAETVTGPAGVLQISPASTGIALTAANDSDFLFRTTISDAAQGIVLANLAQDAGYTSVCNMYVNNVYGQGLSAAFKEAFEGIGGTITAEIPHEEAQPSYVTEMGQCGDADTLAALAYPESAGIFLREAIEGSLFTNYLFADGTKSSTMAGQLGWASLEGVRGTSLASLPSDNESSFAERYNAVYGALPTEPYIKEAYDAVYIIALAAQAAGSTDPTAIRDALRDTSNAPGTLVNPGPEGWTAALAALDAGEDVDYDGVAGPQDFDENGDPSIGAVEWFSVDVAGEAFVQDKVFRADLEAGTVEEIAR